MVERTDPARPPLLQVLTFEMGATRAVQVLARTVWVEDSHHGVRFLGLSDVDRLAIAEYIDRERRERPYHP